MTSLEKKVLRTVIELLQDNRTKVGTFIYDNIPAEERQLRDQAFGLTEATNEAMSWLRSILDSNEGG